MPVQATAGRVRANAIPMRARVASRGGIKLSADLYAGFISKCAGEGLVQERLFQGLQRGELPLIEAGKALGFFAEVVELGRDGSLFFQGTQWNGVEALVTCNFLSYNAISTLRTWLLRCSRLPDDRRRIWAAAGSNPLDQHHHEHHDHSVTGQHRPGKLLGSGFPCVRTRQIQTFSECEARSFLVAEMRK